MTAILISGTSRRSYEPVLKYYDKKSDTAVLKIEAQGFESFSLPARAVRVGERVYAIGNPRGLEQSISEGIVSGLREDEGTLWIQHSAPISPGSSGGALISSRGELLGINSWFVKESQGLNFAVPASTLASAYSGARALQGSLRLPGSPPVSPTLEVAKPSPPTVQNPVGKLDPLMPELVLEKAREAAIGFMQTLPNYVCQEIISRYHSETRPANWHALDVVGTEVVYENGKEDYRKVTLNGRLTGNSIEDTGGSWSKGEFGTMLISLFWPSTATEFHYRRDSRIAGILTKEYDYTIAHATSDWIIGVGPKNYSPGYTGAVWIDPATARVMRIEKQARSFPADFALDDVESAIDYEYVLLSDAKRYLLPVHAETLSCQRGTNDCSRNVIDFRNYRKYTGDSTNPHEHIVRLNVTVSDMFGHRITNLPQSAFTVLENGVPQQIKAFQFEDVPVSMGLIIDSSYNMRDQRQRVRTAAFALAEDSKPQDEVFIVNFNDTAFMDAPTGKEFTNDIKELEEALARIDSRGGAAMRDAISSSIGYLGAKAHRDKKVLVVVTDGNDNASVASLEGLVKSSQQSEISIYAVGLLSYENRRAVQRAKKDLNVLAESTGGESLFPKDISDVARIAHQVSHDIRNQYTIAYTPSNVALDGSFRKISVVVKGPGSPVARTLQGYYARK